MDSPTTATTGRRPIGPGRRWLFRLASVWLGLAVVALVELIAVERDWGRPGTSDDPFVGFDKTVPLFELDESGTRYRIPGSQAKFFVEDSFAARKPPGTFRIFCLGGSTVQGRPWSTETSFTTWLELALEARDSRRNWDVVNCGGISYASYRLVPILEECLRHQPDLVIVCTGHNEFLEDRSYGHLKRMPAALVPLARLRIVGLVRQAIQIARGSRRSIPGRPVLPAEVDALLDYRRGIEAYHRDEAWRRDVTAHFRFNLDRMIRLANAADVPIVLVRPPSNLADARPFKSQHGDHVSEADRRRITALRLEASRLGDSEAAEAAEAGELLSRAVAIDREYAMSWYELGIALRGVARDEEARAALARALELDVCPLRMSQSLATELAEVAREHRTPLVDAHELLAGRCPLGVPGTPLLVDHVHPSFAGHQLIAEALFVEMARGGWVRQSDSPQPGVRDAAWRQHAESLGRQYHMRGPQGCCPASESLLLSVAGWEACHTGR